MSRIGNALANTASRVLFNAATVTSIVEHNPHFRTIELTGDDLAKASWNVGDKIQIRTQPEGLVMRTYTPVALDPSRRTMSLLAYIHGSGPGSDWARDLTAGQQCRFMGPRTSVKLDETTRPIVFVGDETSFALAAAWHGQHPSTPPVGHLFEVDHSEECAAVLDAVGVPGAQLFTRTDDASHLAELDDRLDRALRDHPDATVCLTGKAQSIATLRRRLKDRGLTDHPTRVKAYWDENRSGLD